ncbi:MAG: homoserine dehydrogenase [Candidatus Methylomirabilia bacterium]
MDSVKVGLIGFGTVGTGVVRVLQQNTDIIRERLGFPLALARIADQDTTSERGVSVDPALLTTDARALVEDPSIPIVVELIGGLSPAKEFLVEALRRGKCVVTANKALLAHAWEEVFGAAAAGGGAVGFEASVGGGIPIIRGLREGLAANRIQSMHGIINGTTNYILSRMTDEGLEYASVLKKAQELGFAEADPTLDVEGHDAAHKLAILASLAFGTRVRLDQVHTEGIGRVTKVDIAYARELGYVIKLLAIAKDAGGAIEVRVHPTLVPARFLLATVGGAFNAVYVRGDAVGPTLFYGLGAGSLPTASAVVADVMEMARRIKAGAGAPKPLAVALAPTREVLPMDEVVCPCYIRIQALDKPGVLAAVAGILARNEISIASVIQKEREKGRAVPIVLMTHEAKGAAVRAALEEVGKLPTVSGHPLCIRVEKGE